MSRGAWARPQGKQREQLLAEQRRQDELNNEVEAIKATLGKAATELSQSISGNEAARTALDDKRRRLDAARQRYLAARRRLDDQFTALDSLEAKVAELEAIRRAEEARLRAVIKESEDLKKEQFRRGQK